MIALINNMFPGLLRRPGLKLLLLVVLVSAALQGCMTTSYNNKNWRKSPASTGRNRCGCLLEKSHEIVPRQYVHWYQA